MQQQLRQEFTAALYEKTRSYSHFDAEALRDSPQRVEAHRAAIYNLVNAAFRAGENLGELRVAVDTAFTAAVRAFPQNDLPIMALYQGLVASVLADIQSVQTTKLPGLEVTPPQKSKGTIEAA